MPISRRSCLGLFAAGAGSALGARRAGAVETIRLGMLHTLSPAPFYIAQERGYFTDEGVAVRFVFFDAAQPIAAAAVAGDIDVGVTALTGGFFSLAGKGALKVIGGALHEQKGFHLTAVLASKKAFDAGLTSIGKLGGHSFGITQYGSSFHYMIGRLAEISGFDLKSVTLRPLQSVANMLAAVRTGQVDATMAIASMARPAAASGDAHIIGWVGDVVPYQITALFTTQKMITQRTAALKSFCQGYARGIADYRAAFLDFDDKGQPVYNAITTAVLPMIEKYVFTGDPNADAKIKAGIGWYDAGGALDVADVKSQLAWYEAQGMVKGPIDPASVIDTSFMQTR
jgi:NitT/TauT family transport system substrate-binding protein